MKKYLKKFFKSHYDGSSPLLLAFSGGPDSTALLYILLSLKKVIDFPLHVAHVDHGWRKESEGEQKELEKKINLLNLPFHKTKIYMKNTSNLEDEGRKERLSFFSKLCKKFGFQAVLFGHHKDDLIETVLKRILEGANLQNLYGMKEVSKYEEMTLWRPLLSFSKERIHSFLSRENISYIDDITNRDTKFLRARMREDILPYLEQNFGKKFTENIFQLSQRSLCLKESLEKRCQALLPLVQKGPFGLYFDSKNLDSFTSFEKQYFIHLLLQKQGLDPSRSVLEKIYQWCSDGGKERRIYLQGQQIIIDRQKIFFLKQLTLPFPCCLPIAFGKFQLGKWTISIEPLSIKKGEGDFTLSWEDLWKGKTKIYVPNGTYELSFPSSEKKSSINKWWSHKKVPPFLRNLFPLVLEKGEVVADLLSGYRGKKVRDIEENAMESFKIVVEME